MQSSSGVRFTVTPLVTCASAAFTGMVSGGAGTTPVSIDVGVAAIRLLCLASSS